VNADQVRTQEADLSAAVMSAILRLKVLRGWTDDMVGRKIGYPDGNMVAQILHCAKLPRAVHFAALYQLCRAHGVTDLREALGETDAVPAPDLPAGYASDDSPLDEVDATVQAVAAFSRAYDRCEDESYAAVVRVFQAGRCCLEQWRRRWRTDRGAVQRARLRTVRPSGRVAG
jgi:hypothetical protein